MEAIPTLAALQVENDALKAKLAEREKQLYHALGVVVGMWNQYCPPPRTHMCMNAGEDAEELLKEWELLLPDETAIDFWGLWWRPEGIEVPQKVHALIDGKQ
ncbi:hypothetical protein ACFST9_19955 [Hymenobacter monticola]|uniref:Uncharacterized protein n=1 Tax=Hymenobacter monticola TaxID=1705399 RepID=A0ABY4B6F5_9BACT|nr:hypothetical protein [Hymenobacter monticola]UOE34620.1 hypothetical protein MTP16_02955 [Hymenobacter monticola]